VKEKVDIISMSWSIDMIPPKNKKEDERVTKLREAIREATDGKPGVDKDNEVLLFCAWPDKGKIGPENMTYPKCIDPKQIIDIGAATSDGSPWPKVGDGKPDFFLPGVDLGIPLKTEKRAGSQPPQEYNTYSGSSLSCALAAGLAAMILYCARRVESNHAWYLKKNENMKSAFKRIKSSEDGWVAVNQFFGHTVIKNAMGDDREKVLREIVKRFVQDMDLGTTMDSS
jgi:hypothetical protein